MLTKRRHTGLRVHAKNDSWASWQEETDKRDQQGSECSFLALRVGPDQLNTWFPPKQSSLPFGNSDYSDGTWKSVKGGLRTRSNYHVGQQTEDDDLLSGSRTINPDERLRRLQMKVLTPEPSPFLGARRPEGGLPVSLSRVQTAPEVHHKWRRLLQANPLMRL